MTRKYPSVRILPEARILPGGKIPCREFSAVSGWSWNRDRWEKCFLYAQKNNRLVRFVRPREVVASIASCARPVSGYRARVPHRYVPAAFPPRARGPAAVRRPPTHPRASTRFAFRRRRRVFFSCHVECVNNERVCISPEARGRRPRARPVAARASRACLARRPRRPRESDPLPRRSPPRPQCRACCLEKKSRGSNQLFRARDVFASAKVARLRLHARRGDFFHAQHRSESLFRFFARGTAWRSL